MPEEGAVTPPQRSSESHACPLCGAREVAAFVTAPDGAFVRRCAHCGFGFTGSSSPDARGGYDRIYGIDEHPHPLTIARYEQLLAQLEPYRRTGRLVEIGFGRGDFLRTARRHGWDVVGTETSVLAVAKLREEGITVLSGESATRELPREQFDVAVALEVIEHVGDFAALLVDLRTALRPGGLLVLSTPNLDSLTRRFIGSRWRIFATEHRWYFSPGTLRHALRGAGFRPLRVESRNLYPPDIVEGLRRRLTRSDRAAAGWAAASGLREFTSRSRLGASLKIAANAILGLTGTGDTIWARALRE